ncbi:MAG TPA: Hpt domain-containing protein [Burkholderiaceae bacterium]|nr:Hpt domain-containing protein [Burkholderiaceae bacterium]
MRESHDPNELAGVAQDIAPLAWVIDEIRSSLNQALAGIRTFLANKQDIDSLRAARNQVHQTNGALQLLDLRGVSLMTEAIERLLRQWEEQPRLCQPQAARTVENASAAVLAYLDGLLSGRPNQPIRLYPYYRDILQLNGAARIHPADLVFPDLSRRPALHQIETRPLAPEQLRARRARYEEGLLGFLRNSEDPRARRQMRDALADLENLPARGIARSFWWVVRGLLDALDAHQIPVDIDLKRVLARLNLQLRRLIDDGGAVAERLMTDALYYVGRADERVQRVVEVKRLYGLDALMPPDFERPTLTAIDPEALRRLKEAMSQAKPLWIQQSSAATPDLGKFVQELQVAQQAAQALGAAPLVRVLDRLVAIANDRTPLSTGAREALGIEVASALLFIELGVDELPALDAEYPGRAEAVVARLDAAQRGQALPEGGPWESELARRAQDRLTMGAVVAETKATLREIEQRLDRFFRNPAERGELPETAPMFDQVRGVLSMLGHDEPVAALRSVQQAVANFVDPNVPPQPDEFVRIAQNLGALGFFVETLDQEPERPRAMFRYDPVAGVFSADLGQQPVAAGEPEPVPAYVPPPATDISGRAAAAAPVASPIQPAPSPAPQVPATPVPSAHPETPQRPVPPAFVPQPPTVVAERVPARSENLEGKVSERLALAHLLSRRLLQVPTDIGTRQALTAMLPLLDNEADLLDDASLKGRVAQARQALAQLIATPVADVARRIVDVFAPPAPPPPPALTAPLPTTQAAHDRELLEIFVDEAHEVLETIDAGLEGVRRAPDDVEAMTAVRRAFHTLKGSSRMVGLKAFGEGAWAIEQCFNLWLAQARPATEDLIALATTARRLMRNWIAQVGANPDASLDVAPLVHAAQHVREGGAFAYGGNIPSAPADSPGPKGDGSPAQISSPVLPGANQSQPGFDAQPAAGHPAQLDAPVTDDIAAGDHPPRERGADAQRHAAADAGHVPEGSIPPASADAFPSAAADSAFFPGDETLDFDAPLAADDDPLSAFSGDLLAGSIADASDAGSEEAALRDVDARDGAFEPLPPFDADAVVELPPVETTHGAAAIEPAARAIVAEPPRPMEEPRVEPIDEAAAPLFEAMSPEPPAGVADSSGGRGDETRRIGPIEISHGLYSVFLAEADECVRTLLQDVSEWRYEATRPPSHNAMRRAHSLAGISATVGLRPVWNLADPLDDLLTELGRGASSADGPASDLAGTSASAHATPLLSAPQFDVLERVVERIRGMLHVFAAGLYPNDAPLEAGAIQDMLRVVRAQESWRLGDHGASAASPPQSLAATAPEPARETASREIPPPMQPPAPEPAAGDPVDDLDSDQAAPSSQASISLPEDVLALISDINLDLDVPPDSSHAPADAASGEPIAGAHDVDARDVTGHHVAGHDGAAPADADAGADADVGAPALDAIGAAHEADFDPFSPPPAQFAAGPDAANDLSGIQPAGVPAQEPESTVSEIVPSRGVVIPLVRPAATSTAPVVGPPYLAPGVTSDATALPEGVGTLLPLRAEPVDGEAPEEAGRREPSIDRGDDAAHAWTGDSRIAGHPESLADAPPLDAPREPARTVAGAAAKSLAERLAANFAAAAAVASTEPGPGPGPAAPEAPAVEPPPRARDELDPDLLPVFVTEAQDLLPAIGTQLRALAGSPNDREVARDLMRRLHTVKGSARMAGAMSLGDMVHDMEARIESAMQLVNVPSVIVDDLQTQFDHVLSRFEALQAGRDAPSDGAAAAAAAMPADASAMPIAAATAPIEAVALGGALAAAPVAAAGGAAPPAAAAFVRVRADILDKLVDHAGEVAISRSKLENEVGTLKSALSDLTENIGRLRTQLREVEIQADAQIQARADQLSKESAAFDPLEFDRYSRLQELTRLLAESVEDVAMVQSNMLRDLQSADNDLSAQSRLTRDLQQQLMRVRLVPFSNVAERLYRVARQTSKEVGKRINLEIRGGTTEIDRSVLERMAAPFEHLLRNSIVHGLETPHDRVASGKPETGELLLEVSQQGNEIVVVYSDDGAGLNLDRIRRRGIEKQLIGANQVVSDRDLIEMIFAPGFSTATEVTELAGRGVGLDVVRSELASFGGRIAVATEAGRGTRFTLYLPLTLSVTQVVLATIGQRRFAIPAGMVEQVKRFRPAWVEAALRDGVVDVAPYGTLVVRPLAQLLGEDLPLAFPKQTPLAVLRSGEDRLAIVADEISSNQEVVVKNVGPQVSRLAGLLGATILGTGEIVLIVNPVQLIARAPEPPQFEPPTEGGGEEREARALDAGATILVVDDSLTVRRVTQRLLERQGYSVILAKDGVDALRRIQETRPDLMLVDIEMPRMDGFDLTRNIRGNPATRAIPIIIITSRTAEKHRRVAFEIGVNEYLGKPYRDEELLELIRRYLGLRTPA